MTFLDIILAIPLAWFIYKGLKQGLVYELAALIGILLGAFLAVNFSELVANILGIDGGGAALIAFFITFVGVVMLSYVLGRFASKFLSAINLGVANKLLGALFGMLKCVCILSVILYYITYLDSHEKLITKEQKEKSWLYKPVEKTGNLVIGGIKDYVNEHSTENDTDTEDSTTKEANN